MPNLDLYTSQFIAIDGKLLVEETSLSVVKKSGLNPVFTVAKGFAGMSQGATTCEISVENAVPSADFELNPDAYMKSGAVVEVGIIMAGRQTVLKGFITEATYQHSVNDAGKLSFTIMGTFENFE